MKNEKWYKYPLAFIIAIPFIVSLSIYHSLRMLVVSFKQSTVLKLDQFGNAKKLDVEHGFMFNRSQGWNAPVLLQTTADSNIELRRKQMWKKKVINILWIAIMIEEPGG